MDARHLWEGQIDGLQTVWHSQHRRLKRKQPRAIIIAVSLILTFPGLAHSSDQRTAAETEWRQHAAAGKSAFAKGDLKSAEMNLRRALKTAEDANWHDDRLVQSLNDLASVRFRQGDLQHAERLLQRALETTKQHRGADHPHVAAGLFNLAYIHLRQRQLPKALQEGQQAVQLIRKNQGENHANYGAAMNNLANLYLESKQFERSQKCYETALAIFKTKLGSKHPRVILCLNSIAMVHRSRGKFDEAQRTLQKALGASTGNAQVSAPVLALIVSNMAMVHLDGGHFARAEPLLQASLSSIEAALGKEHPRVIDALMNLADCKAKRGKASQAMAHYRRAAKIAEKRLPERHPVHRRIRDRLVEIGGQPAAKPLAKRTDDQERVLLQRFPVAKDGRLIIVPVKLKDMHYSFLLDTGSPITLFDNSLKRQLGKVIRKVRVVTQNGAKQLEVFSSPQGFIGQLPLQTNGWILCTDLTELRRVSGHDIRGTLGMEFHRRHVIRLDYDRKRLDFLKSAENVTGTRIPLAHNLGGTPMIEVAVGGLGALRFSLSTGTLGSGTIARASFRQLEAQGSIQIIGTTIRSTIAGKQKQRAGRVNELRVAGFATKGLIFDEMAANTL